MYIVYTDACFIIRVTEYLIRILRKTTHKADLSQVILFIQLQATAIKKNS